MALALVVPLFLISESCCFVAPPAEEYQTDVHPVSGSRPNLVLLIEKERQNEEKRQEIIEDSSTQDIHAYNNALIKTAEHIEYELKYWKVIPDLLDEAPKLPMQAWWYDGPEAMFGNEINDQNVISEEPFWLEWKADNNSYYTMVMVGIDEKTKEYVLNKEKQFWLVGNIKAYDFIAGEYLTEYVGPKPEQGTRSHRYVFLVYKQPKKITFKEPKIGAAQEDIQRTNFSSKLFSKKYNLGKPIAVNFFRARFISYY